MNNYLSRKALVLSLFAITIGVIGSAKVCLAEETSPAVDTEPCIDATRIPADASVDPATPGIKRERRLWADSWLWSEGPEFRVEKWLSEKPEREGKYVLIEFWATWCGPCRRSIPLLNQLHKKYGDELVVIGVGEESEEATRKLTQKHPTTPEIEFFSAIDTKKQMKDELGVWGIPHVIILEPGGYVIWEGFPLQPGYELTDEIVERILAVGRKLKQAQDG